jgi:molecular chaperone GrpE
MDALQAIAAERDEMKDRMLRIAADFENWKKRARKEQTDAELRARESVLKDLLEVMDNLERALGASAGQGGAPGADVASILKGIELVLRIFQGKLERYEVKPIEAKGKPFDPHLHEAISRVETADAPAGTVVTELQRGYRIGDRLLRPSMVSVAAAPAAPAGAREGGPA